MDRLWITLARERFIVAQPCFLSGYPMKVDGPDNARAIRLLGVM
jgi:hypothetical protein